MCDLRMSMPVAVIDASPRSVSWREVEREDVLAPHDPGGVGEAVAKVEPARRAGPAGAVGVEHAGAGPRPQVIHDRIQPGPAVGYDSVSCHTAPSGGLQQFDGPIDYQVLALSRMAFR